MARHCRPFLRSPSRTTPPALPPLLLFFYPRRRRSPAVPPPPTSAAAMAAASPSSWACSRCTFLNPSSQKSACEMCLSSPPPSTSSSSRVLAGSSSSSSVAQWACKACTFFNSVEVGSCELCGTKAGGGGAAAAALGSGAAAAAAALGGGRVGEVEDGDGRLVGSVFFPLRRCKRRIEEAPESERSHEGKKAAVVSTLGGF